MAYKETDIDNRIVELIREQIKKREIENVPEHINKLLVLKEAFFAPCDFKVGDLVVWKQGFMNKSKPAINEPALVTEILEQPLKDLSKDDSGTPYFNEPLDLILGLIDEDGDLMLLHYDKRRFKLYQKSE